MGLAVSELRTKRTGDCSALTRTGRNQNRDLKRPEQSNILRPKVPVVSWSES